MTTARSNNVCITFRLNRTCANFRNVEFNEKLKSRREKERNKERKTTKKANYTSFGIVKLGNNQRYVIGEAR